MRLFFATFFATFLEKLQKKWPLFRKSCKKSGNFYSRRKSTSCQLFRSRQLFDFARNVFLQKRKLATFLKVGDFCGLQKSWHFFCNNNFFAKNKKSPTFISCKIIFLGYFPKSRQLLWILTKREKLPLFLQLFQKSGHFFCNFFKKVATFSATFMLGDSRK